MPSGDPPGGGAPAGPGEAGGLSRAARKGLAWTALQSWGVQVLSLLMFLFLARLLEPRAFGLVALTTVFLQIAQIAVDQGLSAAIIQREKVEPEHLDAAFWIGMAVAAAFTAGTIAAAPAIAMLFGEPAITPILRVLSFLFIAGALSGVHEALLVRGMRFRVVALRSLAATAISGVVGVSMAFAGFGVMALVAQDLAFAAVSVVVLWTASGWRPRFAFSARHYRELVGFSGGILGLRVMNFLTRRSDDLLIGRFLGPVALGYYSVAYKVFKVFLDMFTKIVSRVALPTLSRVQRDPEALRGALRGFLRLSALAAFPVFVGVAATAPDVVQVLFGPRWAASAQVMRVLAVVGVAQALSLVLQQGIVAMGRPSWTFAILTATTGLTVAGFALVVDQGIVAVAAVYALVNWLTLPAYALLLRRLVGLRLADLVAPIRAPVAGCLTMLGAIWLVRQAASGLPPAPLLLALATAAAAAYALTVLCLDPALPGDVRALLRRGAGRGRSGLPAGAGMRPPPPGAAAAYPALGPEAAP
ncbi:MAG TPA: lipopolysaccharide biosynthesis protein [Longimicrobium sp.]|nr:lipopolysaccharide biosynthesis protein [Longimicrobium sp.]